MSESQKKRETPPAPASTKTVLFLIATMADTAWRMFVPIIGLTIAGVALDVHWQTKPWLTIAGIVLGVAIAALLVARQLRKTKS